MVKWNHYNSFCKNRINVPAGRRVRSLHGFTLIELLVVIAIVSLLVSILLPSLQRAKELAKETVCLTNLRGWALPLEMYQNDCEMLPGHCYPYFDWETLLREGGYVEDPWAVCPSIELIEPQDATYGANAWLWGAEASGCLNGDLKRVGNSPDSLIMMAEFPFEKYNTVTTWGAIFGQLEIGDYHRGSGNFLFLDNHVEWLENSGDSRASDPDDLVLYYQYWWPYVNPLD